MVDWQFCYEICIRAKQDVPIERFFRVQAYIIRLEEDRFENRALHHLFHLPSTLIRHENGAWNIKRSSNQRNLKTPSFVFVLTENISTTDLFKNDDNTIITWFLWSCFLQTQIQNDRWFLLFKCHRCSLTENLWCVFRVKPPFSNSSGDLDRVFCGVRLVDL